MPLQVDGSWMSEAAEICRGGVKLGDNLEAAVQSEMKRVVSKTWRLTKEERHTYSAWYDVPPRKETGFFHPDIKGAWFSSAREAAISAVLRNT